MNATQRTPSDVTTAMKAKLADIHAREAAAAEARSHYAGDRANIAGSVGTAGTTNTTATGAGGAQA